MPPFHCDHVAILVASLSSARNRLIELGCPVDEIASCPGEGTREMYVGPRASSARLLVCEATDADGPYRRALDRRGPGLHHLAVRVPDVDIYIGGLAGSGWFLLPGSLSSYKRHRTVWLARPGVGALIEVMEGADDPGPAFVADVEVPVSGADVRMIERLGLPGRPLMGVHATAMHSRVTIAGIILSAASLRQC